MAGGAVIPTDDATDVTAVIAARAAEISTLHKAASQAHRAMGDKNRTGEGVAPAKGRGVNAATTAKGGPTEGMDNPTTNDAAGQARP